MASISCGGTVEDGSTFMENSLKIEKALGDILGLAFFASSTYEADEKKEAETETDAENHNDGYFTKEERDIANSIPVESLLVGVETKTDYQGFIDKKDYKNLQASANKIGYQHLLGKSKYKCFDKVKETLKKMDINIYNTLEEIRWDL